MPHSHHDHTHHDHSHYHIHFKESKTKIVVLLTFIVMCLELIFGYTTKSIALQTDGWHMLSHILVLGLAWLAFRYIKAKGQKMTESTQQRVISLSGFASATILITVSIFMVVESIKKLLHLEVHPSHSSILIAIIGILVNGTSAYLLHQEEEMDHNLKGAYLHVISDVLLSFLALISLVAAQYFSILWLDPVSGFIGAAIIFKWSFDLIKKSWREIILLKK